MRPKQADMTDFREFVIDSYDRFNSSRKLGPFHDPSFFQFQYHFCCLTQNFYADNKNATINWRRLVNWIHFEMMMMMVIFFKKDEWIMQI